MKLIRAKDKVKPAIESFFKNYRIYAGSWPFYTQERFDRMSSLNPDTATPEDIIREMNSSWVLTHCTECDKEHDIVMEIGQESDIHLCKECAYKVFDMIVKAAGE